MQLCLSFLEVIGFVVLSTSAGLVALVFSVVLSILRILIKLLTKLYQILTRLSKGVLSTATKADTRWIVIRLGKFSILLGRKDDVSKSDS